ncbi:transglycosylase domain-containing protein [Mycolicibacter sp. MYC098]|uniref:Transglycosylase domain-containing protein n=1 Tax=[Mycobacterium] crassicus TaxID=2872309 RepID=A0ABU5XE01_9MYCO|nr:transglycosylase domain-containing protein [Mycolicibacter sp. MYC098]MEB3020043.1 transglycosylase domain-containing protein [Mycolicibacter sp. MYC098]
MGPSGDGRPPSRRAPVGPDDRHTTIIPAVDDAVTADLRDPIDAVRAALDGTPPQRERALSGRIPRREPPPEPPAYEPDARPPRPTRRTERTPAPPSPLDWLRRHPPNWRWIRRGIYASFAVMLLLPIITFAMAYSITDVPSPGDIRTNQVSTILANDGSELAKIIPPEGNRVDIGINQVPVYVRNAVLAAEDRDFYSNPGFSVSGFARAIKNNIFGGDTQGGSTITQQYVKNALVGSERAGMGGLVRKAKELVIATKMSSAWPKDDVLQAYLNIIYFGRGAYGIAAASRAYFDKPVEELDVAEGALLAALIQRPSTLDPAVDPEGAVERWDWVLDGMVETGALTPGERAAQDFPATVSPEVARSQNITTGPNGLIQRQVTKELLDLFNIDEQTLNTQGLQITTTIDPQAQDAAEDAVQTYLKNQIPNMRTAVVSIDPRNGAVRAYYGGSDANGFDFAQAGLQTGSSFKVFALVAALEQGIGLGYQIDSSPLTIENGRIKITNAEGESCGVCNIAEALKRSLNTAYYRLMLKLKNGAQDVADAAHQAGVAKSFPGVPHTLSQDGGPPEGGVVLGQYQTRVIDMASAYATLADSGIYHPPHFVQKVVNAEGQVLFDAETSEDTGEQRIPKAVADNVTSAMQPIAGWSRGHNLAGGRPSAAKTGTTQLGDTGANRDGWMVGYTPSLSTAVWVGTTGGDEPLVNQWGGPVYGAGIPADIWKATMDGALQGTSNETFPTPTEIGGYAGVPAAPPPPPPMDAGPPPPPEETVIQPTIEIAPGITIPIGPPTTIPAAPPAPPPAQAPPPAAGGPEHQPAPAAEPPPAVP